LEEILTGLVGCWWYHSQTTCCYHSGDKRPFPPNLPLFVVVPSTHCDWHKPVA